MVSVADIGTTDTDRYLLYINESSTEQIMMQFSPLCTYLVCITRKLLAVELTIIAKQESVRHYYHIGA